MVHQVTKRVNEFPVFCEIDLFLKNDRRYLEFDAEQNITWTVIAFDRFMAGQESIGLHVEQVIVYLHGEGCAEVDEIGVADIGEKRIGESFRILFPQMIKIGFPKKIYQMIERLTRLYPMIVLLEMIDMKKFDVLQGYTYPIKLK